MQINVLVPQEVLEVLKKLQDAGFLAYIVGGCVRDILVEREPKDWDITTNAKPEQILKLFPDSVYENNFGTVAVKARRSTRINAEEDDQRESASNPYESAVMLVEVTTFRTESGYDDYRRPSEVKFVETIEEDLARRDFTINAMAMDPMVHDPRSMFHIIDPFGGRKDLDKKIIRAVGDARERFCEDALRMLRAVRLVCQLGSETTQRDANIRTHTNDANMRNEWVIEKETEQAIQKKSELLKNISQERIRDEFTKTIMSSQGAWGVELFRRYGLLQYIIPELLEGVDVGQNKHHIYTVWEHNLRALAYAISKDYPLEIRLGSLLHDVGKPRTKAGDGANSTFYQHEYVGARMTRDILIRLRFSREVVAYVTHLVKNHLFYYNVGEVSDAGVRRFISRVGIETVDDLIKIREADRIGSGVPKAVPYKLRHLLFMIDKVRKDPISPKMLALNGSQLMEELNISPSPRVGWILNNLLEEVLDDPTKNTFDTLLARARELHILSDKELQELCVKARERKEEYEKGEEDEIKRKHRV